MAVSTERGFGAATITEGPRGDKGAERQPMSPTLSPVLRELCASIAMLELEPPARTEERIPGERYQATKNVPGC